MCSSFHIQYHAMFSVAFILRSVDGHCHSDNKVEFFLVHVLKSWQTNSSPLSPLQIPFSHGFEFLDMMVKVRGHTGKSPAKGNQDAQGIGAPLLWGESERAGTVQSGKEEACGWILSKSVNTWREGAKGIELSSFQWCLVSGCGIKDSICHQKKCTESHPVAAAETAFCQQSGFLSSYGHLKT